MKNIKPTYKIPDAMKLKSIGAGWGGEKPTKKSVAKVTIKPLTQSVKKK